MGRDSLYKIHDNLYRCECGREFKSYKSLISHFRFCNEHIPINKNDSTSKYKIHDNLYRCECGREFNNYQSLNAHLSHCDIHHKLNNTQRKLRPSEINKSMNWTNKTKKEIHEIYVKRWKTYKLKCGYDGDNKLINYWYNKHHTEETKQKIRESTINYIKTSYSRCKPRYNKNACIFINNLNKQNNWNLQHAENGGEYMICGYFVDGYDKKLNIVFEYDEPKHYKDVENNILNDKDINRQNTIIKKLNCSFWRYNEKLNTLYKVN